MAGDDILLAAQSRALATGDRMPTEAYEHRQLAAECLKRAREVKSVGDRVQLKMIAQQHLDYADMVEKREIEKYIRPLRTIEPKRA